MTFPLPLILRFFWWKESCVWRLLINVLIEESKVSFSHVVYVIFLWCVRDKSVIKINSSPFSIKMGHPLVFPKCIISNFQYGIIWLWALRYPRTICSLLKCSNNMKVFDKDSQAPSSSLSVYFFRFFLESMTSVYFTTYLHTFMHVYTIVLSLFLVSFHKLAIII